MKTITWWQKVNSSNKKYDALRGYVAYSFIAGAVFGWIMAR